jgi:hypothetical protein
MTMLGFFKCTYRTYSLLLKILPCALYTRLLSVQDLQSRSCLRYVSSATTAAGPHYIALAWTVQKTLLPTGLLLGDVALRVNRTENTVPVLRAQSLR